MGRKPKSATVAGADLGEFQYVDVYWESPSDNKRSKWTRIKVADLPGFQAEHSNFNVFGTVQRFRNPVSTEEEATYMPLYFDLDSSQGIFKLLQTGKLHLEQIVSYLSDEEHLAILNWKNFGVDVSDRIIYTVRMKAGDSLTEDEQERIMDLRIPKAAAVPELQAACWKANLKISQGDAVKLRQFFIATLGLKVEDVRFWFSGRKGFHVLVSARAMGIEPRTDLNHVFKYIALFLKEQLGLEALDYGSIYSSRRMLRLVNSIHQKSKLFKIELSPDEVAGDISDILNMATHPRQPLYDQDSDQLVEAVRTWYQGMLRQYEEARHQRSHKVVLSSEIAEFFRDQGDEATLAAQANVVIDSWPVCVKDIMEHSIKKSSDRNKATMALASFFKDMGYPQDLTEDVLVAWVMRIPGNLTSADATTRKSSTRTCVRTVYESDNYHFGCQFMLALHGERDGRRVEQVACAGSSCPCHPDHQGRSVEAIPVHLADAANADLTGKRVSTRVLVSGKLDTPYIVPKKVQYFCANETGPEGCSKCDACTIGRNGGVAEREFTAADPVLIEATGINKNMLIGVLRAYSGAPSCKKIDVEILEQVNVEELLVVPMAERVKAINTGTEDQPQWKELDESQKPYVARKVYTVGETVQTNQYFSLTGYVYPHPRNMMGTLLAAEKEPLQDNVQQFTLSPEIIGQFDPFVVHTGETLDDRVDVILQDMTDNVTLVWHRDEALLASLLTYHSAIAFDFQGLRVRRGWLETILVGDSGQAKSQLVDNLMDFIGLGERASGESASRTGLVYRLEQMGDRWFVTWGKYPLNDRKLLAVDELAEMSPEDLGRMTEARSTGVLKVDRVINTETNARTRLLFMTNPRNKRPLKEFTHGVEAVKTVFDAPADIRRLDLAVMLASGDVPQDVLNRKLAPVDERHQLIGSEAIKHSVLWAWSRKPEQIVFTEPAVDKILAEAGRLADKYGHAKDIPLMEPADLRIKLARMGVALAALVHSTDDTHEQVVVDAEHVRYVVEYMELVYDAKNCRLDVYSRLAKEEGELTPEEAAEITKGLHQLDFASGTPISVEMLRLFQRNDILKASDIMDMTGFERGEITTRLGVFTKHQLLRKTKHGLRKLPKFLEYLDKYAPAG